MPANHNVPKKRQSGGIRKWDMFGHPIALTFKGEDTYRTACGGGISILCFILFMLFIVNRLQLLILRADPDLTMRTTKSDLSEDREQNVLDLGKLGFLFAINKPEPRIGRVEV